MELDGICVDDPVKFFKCVPELFHVEVLAGTDDCTSRVCDEYSPGECDCEPWSWKRDMNLRRMRFFAWIFHILFRCKYCGLLSPGSYQQRLLRGITGAGSARPREAIRPASEVEQV